MSGGCELQSLINLRLAKSFARCSGVHKASRADLEIFIRLDIRQQQSLRGYERGLLEMTSGNTRSGVHKASRPDLEMFIWLNIRQQQSLRGYERGLPEMTSGNTHSRVHKASRADLETFIRLNIRQQQKGLREIRLPSTVEQVIARHRSKLLHVIPYEI